ncbi:hypothetical protein O1L60_32920 [Streptomyces diastatochromogenes]|nr:hypothetical protein [Streptomyces diastatochromogenes]
MLRAGTGPGTGDAPAVREARASEGVGAALADLDRIAESRTFLRRALEIDRRLRVPDAERLRALLGED